MKDQEHLNIFKQGEQAWNEWRSKNKEIRPDFRGADLRGVSFRGANLSGAILNGSDLSGMDFRGADLSGAELGSANFRGAELGEANLSRTHLGKADLKKANLNKANLNGADLNNADLREANLTEVDLREAKLNEADLSGANLRKAFLHMARLINAKLDGANLTEACLWEIQRAGWSIKGVICESIYLDKEAKKKQTFNAGEFERLFSDATKIRLFYRDGISTLEIVTLPALIQHLEESHTGSRLRFVSIRENSGGAVVELAIEGEEESSTEQVTQLQTALETEAQRSVEYQRLALAEKETRWRLEGEIKQLNSVVKELIHRPTYLISGQAGAVGPNAHAHDMTFNQLVNDVEQSIDLATLATQLAELRQSMMAQQDTSPQVAIAMGKVAEAEIAASEKNVSKVVEHLRTAGQWTLNFAKDIGKDVVAEAIKKVLGME